MKDISITDYLGPGVYLLYHYPQESGALIAEKGYKVCYCNDFSHLADIIDDNQADFILISDAESKFDEYTDIIRLSAQSSIKKVAIDTLVKENQRDLYLNFIEASRRLGYPLDSAFSLLNPGYDGSFHNDQHLRMVLSFSHEQLNDSDVAPSESAITGKSVTSALPYVRPGDRVLVISESGHSARDIKRILSEQTKASMVQICSLDNIEEALQKDRGYHFILVDKYADDDLIKALDSITTSLLPAGRYVFFKASQTVIHALDNLNVQPEVYFIYEHGNLKTKTHQGEEITVSPEICVLMKSPLENTKVVYEETIYSYSSPPENLLAFARDYTHPWLIRGIVEFPFRNRSVYHLKQYSRQILQRFDAKSPDYAAALAVLGYQLLSNGDDSDEILDKLIAYCSGVLKLEHPTPHQYRWYISLSTLLGLIYNKNNDKVKALIHFSHAANTCVGKFSPSIGTKTLQSLYSQTIILISLKKISCAEIIVERGIKRGIQLLYQNPEELVGKISQPFNFVLFIYHDIIDWIIKLVNIKNAISCRKFNIANNDNNNTWSSLLHERMNAISNMSRMIDERDNAIHSQTGLIDERDNTITVQKSLIDERDQTIHAQKNLIDERDKTIHQQNQLIDGLQEEVSTKEQQITELLNKNNEISVLNDEKERHLTQLSADLERASSTLRKINSTPVIGRLLRILNIK
ncbi:hypothetical protein [Klebsiella pneumoniae]|uniref:hypothetical protein n=1 Tax=Klebsiella pneumoniae TaxID=573 RepID=UPI0024AF8F84|nr:hypothetical protein [Klebsiella pneumoniae]MDI7001781.1 hypothetical protein [Klebsiella pneumoniae]HBT1427768.1 hypothetical protein [Klebsiella pneumoniae]